ncbi:MAG TPA: outer membrane beta-barrel protein [Bacteroidales bacterium]|nr:outer membrane beta-barrel protein [Bacteroidales bacterium]
MKRVTLTSALFLVFLNLYAQDHKISIGINGSLGGNKYFKETGFDYEYKTRLTTSLGIDFHYQFNHLFLGSGLGYGTQGYQLKYNYLIEDPGDPAIPRQSDLKVSYISIPVRFGIQLIHKNRLMFYPSVGLDLTIQTKCEENTVFEDNSEHKSKFLIQNLHQSQVIAQLDLGTGYQLSERCIIRVTPFIGKGLSVLDYKSMKTGQLSYGCRFGVYFIL